ncbi:MAG: transglutaminase-like domain-containing protein [Treponema sp.]|nr:transglutaminase-like domain-containing protein [Treponema sp.]MCL2252214.1 transglutaminase-like domain-containing protein [Treponema sp.]
MRKAVIGLFSLRLFLYFSVTMLVFIHPGIAVSFDHIGIMQWFVIVPLMAFIAFIPNIENKILFLQKASLRIKICFLLSLLIIISIIAGGFSFSAVPPFIAGFISFIFTFLLFKRPQWGKIVYFEPFFLAWVCLRLLALSRSGEDVAGQSMALTQFILAWTIVVFLLHNIVIYFCLYPASRLKARKEALVFLFASLAVLLVLLVVLPPDYVRNTVVSNLRTERIPELIKPSDSDNALPREGRSGRRTLPRGEGGQRPNLRGISEHEWPGSGGSSNESRQYMVMIVASEREPVYMGNSFRGKLDSTEGFLVSPQEPINTLAKERIFVTWFNNERETDRSRRTREVFSLSTLQQKYFPWRPISADPVILNENAGPLRYIHQVTSNMHFDDPLRLFNSFSRSLTERDKTALAPYLELPFNDSDTEAFNSYLDKALSDWKSNRETIIKDDRYLQDIFANEIRRGSININNEYIDKILALLVSFSKYQYNLNYDDDHSIASLKNFLFNSAEGDCVEFSNTLALLGRFAGIPSRVVTGYLAAESLQTAAHLRGLAALRANIPVLQQFLFDNLFMVTNIHSHSWTQFYIPNYGWLDFESTAFAIPPLGMGDFNNWDVVIPLINEETTFSQIRKFPWQAVGRAAIILIITALICAYALRYVREIILSLGVKRGGRAGARSLYLLLLARLAADGKPIKPASKTAHEYSELFPVLKEDNEMSCANFKAFADIYSEIRWRQFSESENSVCAEMENRFQLLYKEYKNILSMKKRGPLHAIKRFFSLRGLAYL